MPTPPDTASVTVYTQKEGLLSSVAHDLKIRATRFEIQRDGASVVASVVADSLEVVCAMKGGRPDETALKPKDKAEIQKSIRESVLNSARFPKLSFEGQVNGRELHGRLSLHGQTREIRAALREDGQSLVAEFSLDQRDYGIKPFTAMLGALKVAPVLRVEVRIPQMV